MPREDADYHYSHSREIAKSSLEMTKEFTDRMKKLIKNF